MSNRKVSGSNPRWSILFLGRTGRAGAKGSAYSFFTPDKYKLAKDLIGVLREAEQAVIIPDAGIEPAWSHCVGVPNFKLSS